MDIKMYSVQYDTNGYAWLVLTDPKGTEMKMKLDLLMIANLINMLEGAQTNICRIGVGEKVE